MGKYLGEKADPIAALNKIAAMFPDAWRGVDVAAEVADMRADTEWEDYTQQPPPKPEPTRE
jgi:hypothetical protein